MSPLERKLQHASVTDAILQEWHEQAVGGDVRALEQLFLWVYWEANRYYAVKSRELRLLSLQDAEDLASQFILDYQAVWREVRFVSHYTRYVLKKNLQRHLAARARRARALPLGALESQAHAVTQVHASWMDWSDRGFVAYNVFCDEFFNLPAASRLLIEARLRHPPTPFAALCRSMGMDENRARKQTSRFFRRIRKRCMRLIRPDL